jgi:methyltransferase (TIGR00027 family)
MDGPTRGNYDSVMQSGQGSRTAIGAAGHRAAHQVLERGSIFGDPLAVRILGADAAAAIESAQADPSSRRLRLFIAIRSRFAEDAIAAAVMHGVRQLVVLGAGLDTFAYRSPWTDGLRIFEVDHAATQAWKRERLAAAAIPLPHALTFVPVDFERESLAGALANAGLDPALPAFFTWLGVVPYLTERAIYATLEFIAGLPGGAQVVFDYANPPESVCGPARAEHEALAARVAAAGESFKSFLVTDLLRDRLMTLGFRQIEDLGPAQIAARFFPDRVSSAADQGGHIVRASTI